MIRETTDYRGIIRQYGEPDVNVPELIKYIVEVNPDGQSYDVEVYASGPTHAKEIVMMRKGLPSYMIRVRGEAR